MIELNLDSTCLGKSACMLAIKRTVIDGYIQPAQDARMIYGVALHKYFDIMYKSKGHHPSARAKAIKAFNVPKTDIPAKSLQYGDQNHMICSAFNAWEMYIKDDKDFDLIALELPCWMCDGSGTVENNTCPTCQCRKKFEQPASEITFSFPYYEDDILKVNLCGTIDGVGKIKGGIYAIRDFKSTSAWDTRTYFTPYELSRQLRFYRLALRLMARRFPDSVLGKIGAQSVGAFIDAIFIKPAANDNRYGRSEIFLIKDSEIDEFEKSLQGFIQRIKEHITNNYWPKEGILNGSCVNEKYNKLCQFWGVCRMTEDRIADVILKRDFIVKKFNPLKYNEIVEV